MSTMTTMLARRSLANHGVQAARIEQEASYSFESEIVEMANTMDAEIVEQEQLVAEANGASDNIVASTNGAEGLAGLVDETIAVYGDAGIPQEAAEVLQVSVECVLRAMGMNIPASVVLPSFEGKTRIQYSTEAEEKSQSVIDRIWESIKKAFASFSEFVGSVIAKLRNNINSIQAYSKRVRERVETVKGATPTGELKLGSDGALTKSGEAQSIVNTTNTDYKKFIDAWSKHFDGLLNEENVSAIASNKPDRMRTILSSASAKMPPVLKYQFTPFHDLEITPGASSDSPIVGAKAKVVDGEGTAKDASFKYLSEVQMKETIDAVDAVLLDLVNIEKDVSKWNDTLKRIRSIGRIGKAAGMVSHGLQKKGEADNGGAEMRKAGQMLSGGSRLALDGFNATFGPVLRVLRSNLVYVAKSANGYGKDESKEKPDDTRGKDDVQPDDKKEKPEE